MRAAILMFTSHGKDGIPVEVAATLLMCSIYLGGGAYAGRCVSQ